MEQLRTKKNPPFVWKIEAVEREQVLKKKSGASQQTHEPSGAKCKWRSLVLVGPSLSRPACKTEFFYSDPGPTKTMTQRTKIQSPTPTATQKRNTRRSLGKKVEEVEWVSKCHSNLFRVTDPWTTHATMIPSTVSTGSNKYYYVINYRTPLPNTPLISAHVPQSE